MKYMCLFMTILFQSGLALATINDKESAQQVPITPFDTIPLVQLEGSLMDLHDPDMPWLPYLAQLKKALMDLHDPDIPWLPYLKKSLVAELEEDTDRPWWPYPCRILAKHCLSKNMTNEELLQLTEEDVLMLKKAINITWFMGGGGAINHIQPATIPDDTIMREE